MMVIARMLATVPLLLLAMILPVFADDATKNPDIAALYKSGALFDTKQYPAVRAAFSKAFEARHAATIRAAFGADHDALAAWLGKHPGIKAELFTAIDEANDDVRASLSLFAKLWKEFPDKVGQLPALAIATAVVWDRPRAVYDYRHHQVRCKSSMPTTLADGRANFEYLANGDKMILANVKALPREFLAFVVDNKTPIEERKWAQRFVATQKGTSSWHQSIAYDKGMLETEQTGKGPGPKLAGHEYTLANIKKYGGVCAQQADFVARVGKSLGQPSVYISGESSYRGRHAWVMWVTPLKQAKGTDSTRFALISDGRTRGFEKDAFYVGELTDPQTGRRISDRDMERRLTVVGLGARTRRQTALAMRAYPLIAEQEKFDTKQRLAYLSKVWAMSPYAEEAWRELARLAKAGELSRFKGTLAAKQALLMRTFAKWPDFIASISSDLLAAEQAAGQVRYLGPQLSLYEKKRRPDLACDAGLKLASALREQGKSKEAARELARTVRKFPTEGRYVPKLLKALEDASVGNAASTAALAKLYLDLTPALMRHYKGEGDNKFLNAVIRQGQDFFARSKLTRQAAQFRALTGGKG